MVDKHDVDMLCNLHPDDIDKKLLISLFVNRAKKPAKYKMGETMVIPPGKYHGNKEPIQTTLGRFIYNKFIVEESFYEVLGYINEPITNSKHNEIEKKLSQALMDDIITVQQFKKYLNKIQWLGMDCHNIISPSLTVNMLQTPPEVRQMKEKLSIQNAEKLAAGDVKTGYDMERQLLGIARESMKNDSAMDLFNSGAKGSFDNNYKAMRVMKGPIMDMSTGKYNVSTACYSDGIKKSELAIYADTIVNGAYATAVNTQVAGYMTKQINAGFQNVVLDAHGTDCGSKLTLEVFLTNENFDSYMYQYIMDKNGNPIELTNKNRAQYVGHIVHLRSPIGCTSDSICSICGGERYYKLEIEAIGTTETKISTSIMNQSLKKKHDTTVKMYDISPDNLTL